MGTPTTPTDSHKFTIDTKGNCFMCLKSDSGCTEALATYSFQRLCKYLQLDFKNIYKISFPMASISMLENSEILVSLCYQCSAEANKFVKLHKDLELIRKRVNICVGRIRNLMVEADNNPKILQEYRQRMTVTANPLELIQASIAENLRKETIKQCSKLNTIATVQNQPITSQISAQPSSSSTQTFTSPVHSASANITQSQLEISRVSTTTKTTFSVGQVKDVLVVDLDDSDEEDNTEEVPIIKSVTGASGNLFLTGETHQYNQISSLQRPTRGKQPSVTTVERSPSSSFNALQNFTTDYNFDLRDCGTGGNSNQALTSPSSPHVAPEGQEWTVFTDGSCQCNICGKIIQRSDTNVMTTHMRIHAGIKPIACDHCNQTFRCISNRRMHVLTYHRKEIFSHFHYPAVPNKTFQNVIDMVFKNVNKVDNSDRPYKCLYCERQYRHRSDVEAHMVNIHFNTIGSKLMELQRQGAGGDTSFSSIHTDDPQQVLPTGANISSGQVKRKKFPCSTCGMKFRYVSILSKHVTIGCTGKKPGTQAPGGKLDQGEAEKTLGYVIKWKCGICSSAFGSQSDLKRHKSLKHTTSLKSAVTDAGPGATVYKCPYCVKKFRFYYSQRVHMLTLHRYTVFCKYVPEGTSTSTLDNAIQNILETCKVSEGSTHCCKFCNRDFTGSVASILQNHILVSHFQEVVKKLKNAVEEAGTGQVHMMSSGNPEDEKISVKQENENAVEVVLPD